MSTSPEFSDTADQSQVHAASEFTALIQPCPESLSGGEEEYHEQRKNYKEAHNFAHLSPREPYRYIAIQNQCIATLETIIIHNGNQALARAEYQGDDHALETCYTADSFWY
ncbi:hypothetical protein B0H19DRAFT_1259703 [Mycena capillaripes]|nr:hypothetical protein B0H19DRAFT_1259703 [Mycena capillaripes]